jgi:hypothetical protein
LLQRTSVKRFFAAQRFGRKVPVMWAEKQKSAASGA